MIKGVWMKLSDRGGVGCHPGASLSLLPSLLSLSASLWVDRQMGGWPAGAHGGPGSFSGAVRMSTGSGPASPASNHGFGILEN